jgi:hypothetical protein
LWDGVVRTIVDIDIDIVNNNAAGSGGGSDKSDRGGSSGTWQVPELAPHSSFFATLKKTVTHLPPVAN